MEGAKLTIADADLLSAGTVSGGTGGGGPGNTPAQAFAHGICLQGNNALSFTPSGGGLVDVKGVIGDDQGSAKAAGYSGAANYTPGSAGITVNGSGTVRLDANNTYAGSSTISAGKLELASGATAGTGVIKFAGSAATLQIDGPTTPSNKIDAFALGDVIDLNGLAFVSSATTAQYNSATQILTVSAGGTSRQLTLTNPGGTIFSTASDGSSGTLVTLTPTIIYVSSGQTSNGLTISSGITLDILSGGTAIATTVLSGGTELVQSGGKASGSIIEFFGSEVVSGGGTDVGAQISGGEQDVLGSASGATIFDGEQVVSSGGSASGTQVKNGGLEIVGSGGTDFGAK